MALPNTYYVEKSGKSVAEHLELLGDGVLNHTLVLPKCGVWQEAYTTIGEYMEKRGKGSLLDCGKNAGQEATFSTTGDTIMVVPLGERWKTQHR